MNWIICKVRIIITRVRQVAVKRDVAAYMRHVLIALMLGSKYIINELDFLLPIL
jgi:hypothetical protein